MNIVGIEGMTGKQLSDELRRGARFVMFHYCISIVVMTFRRGSDVHFVRAGESAVAKGLGYSVLSFFLGWWGIPWGPIYTVGSLITNFGGGKDVTAEGVASLSQSA